MMKNQTFHETESLTDDILVYISDLADSGKRSFGSNHACSVEIQFLPRLASELGAKSGKILVDGEKVLALLAPCTSVTSLRACCAAGCGRIRASNQPLARRAGSSHRLESRLDLSGCIENLKTWSSVRAASLPPDPGGLRAPRGMGSTHRFCLLGVRKVATIFLHCVVSDSECHDKGHLGRWIFVCVREIV